MTPAELSRYLERLKIETETALFIPRRFTAATTEGGAEPDLDFQWRGALREGEPQLPELLKHPRLIILGEPGAGKSLIARAAVHEILRDNRVPVFSELKQYRGSLQNSLQTSAPRSVLEPNAAADGKLLKRTYVLDGIDEIPRELLGTFGKQLEDLLGSDNAASAVLTARQAFYVSERVLLSQFPAVFHILDFSDDDIRDFLEKKQTDADAFMQAVRTVEAEEEIRNPFALSVMVERFVQSGSLSKLRSQNLSYIIGRLIQNRPLVDQQRQRRTLCFLALACETYCRNELSEDEALRVIRQAMRITDDGAREVLSDLHASILKRSVNGFGFQMRSYGEYLAAEALQDEPIERLRQLAFSDHDTPNESWTNTIAYLAEINPDVRRFFVAKYPLWVINSSPAAFSDEEKAQIVKTTFQTVMDEGHYIYRHPRISLRRLARFLTASVEAELLPKLTSPEQLVRGNALVLLSLRQDPRVLPPALAILEDRTLDPSFRQCAVLALMRAGTSALVPQLLAFLDEDEGKTDPLHNSILDAAGALSNESQFSLVLPRLLEAGSILSAAFYHFRDFRSREALVSALAYLVKRPEDLNSIRAEGYLEPIFKCFPKYWDGTIGQLCLEVIQRIDLQKIFPDRSGIAYKLFRAIREADTHGTVARAFLDGVAKKGEVHQRRWYYVDQLIADLTTLETGQWLIEQRHTELIQQLSPFLHGQVRDLLRPFSEGLIDSQEENARAYAAERAEKENIQKQEITQLQGRIVTGKDFSRALNDFYMLKEAHWPEVSVDHKQWLGAEVSKFLVKLDLEHSIVWTQDALTVPAALSVLLKMIHRYELKIDPDTPLIFATASWDEKIVSAYYRRHGLSVTALDLLNTLLLTPDSPRALAGIIAFVRDSGLWSVPVQNGLKEAVLAPDEMNCQIDALHLLAEHGVETELLERLASAGASRDLRQSAFTLLVGRKHRPTIERALSALLEDEQAVQLGESGYPMDSSLSWIAKVKSDFAVPKLVGLRAKALKLQLPGVVGLLTETLAKINRAQTAQIISRQIALAPCAWKEAQQLIAIEQDRAARIEMTRESPFEVILTKLKRSTSIKRLKLWCEGPTDVPIFKALLAQVPDTPEIFVDFVGGWEMLQKKDPQTFLHGCYEAIVVMDGDKGRELHKRRKPLTKLARSQVQRISGLPVELHVLQRYAIENYLPQSRLEAIIGQDLSRFFPIPDDVSACEYLRADGAAFWPRIKRLLVAQFGVRLEFTGRPLYKKNSNDEIARLLDFDKDFSNTDLHTVVLLIAKRAKELAES